MTLRQLTARRTDYGYDVFHGKRRLCIVAQPVYELTAGIRPTHEDVRAAVREAHPEIVVWPAAWVRWDDGNGIAV